MMTNSVHGIALDEKSREKKRRFHNCYIYFIFPFLPSISEDESKTIIQSHELVT